MNQLKKLTIRCCQHIPSRQFATGWEKRMDRQPERDTTVFKDSRNSKHQNDDRVLVFGFTGTGALGIKEFIDPPTSQHRPPRDKQLTPKKLDFINKQSIKVTDLCCGYGFTVIAGRQNGEHKLFGCGINTDSQIGFKTLNGKPLFHIIEPHHIKIASNSNEKFKFKKVSCGRAHTVVLTESNLMISMGNNAYGQCGRSIVDGEIFKGSQLTNQIASFTDSPLLDVQCGQDHTLLLTQRGQVFSCGLGADGQTGQGHYDYVDRPTLVGGDIENESIVQLSSKGDCVLAVNDKGDLFGWGNSEYNQLSAVSNDTTQVHLPRHLPFANIGRVKKAVACGSMCAVLNDVGEVFVWGYGILGAGPSVTMADAPLRLEPALFGRTDFTPERKVVDLEAGLNYFMATTDIGELYVWGKNKMGCLGIGHNKDQMFPIKAHIPGMVKRVTCGVDHTVILANSFNL